MKMPTRNAIIISCPGSGRKHLPGAVRDLENMSNYLRSPRGGAWKNHEIFCLNNPTWLEVKRLLNQCMADYQFIYFAGHGCSGENQTRYLTFKDQNIEDIRLLTHNAKQLIIVDACRVYYAAISGIPPAEDVFSTFTGETDARKIFDNCIMQSPNGRMIVHATAHNSKAEEERYHRGGAFTLSLLVTALNVREEYDLQPFYIKDLLPTVRQTLISQGYKQFPEIPYEKGDLRVPFMIDADQIIIERNTQEEEYLLAEIPQKPSFLKVVAVAALVIAIIRGFRNGQI